MAARAAPLPTPEQLVAELVLLLDLEPRGGDKFVGRKQPEGSGRVFGGQAIAQALVAAVVIVVAREALRGRGVGFLAALRGVRERFWRVVGAQLLATLGVLLLALTVIGLPFALWKLVGWSFVQQEVIFTDKGFRESFRASSELVGGRWFRTAREA